MARKSGLLAILFALVPNVIVAQKIDGDSFFDADNLRNIEIRMKEADWNTLRFQSRNIATMMSGGMVDDPFTFFQADIVIDGQPIENVGIRKKGLFGSADSDRPSLKISFDEFQKQEPIDGLIRLTLNNNKQDTSQLSQSLSYYLFRKAGIHAPRSNFTRVTVNGQDLGIYSNVESIDKPFLEKSFGDRSGNLYEGTLTDFHPRTIDKFEIKTNKSTSDGKELKQLAGILASEGNVDIEALKDVLDLDYFLRYWAMEGLLRFWDGYASNQNNFFIYFDPAKQHAYFIPWGADAAFSKDGGPFGMIGGRNAPKSFYAQSILCNRLYHTDGIPELYRKTALLLLDEVWNEEELLEMIDRSEKLITPWLHHSQKGTSKAIDELRDFIRDRRQVASKELESTPFRIAPEPRKPMYQVSVGEIAGSFKTRWKDGPGDETSGTSSVDLDLQLDGTKIAMENLTATVAEFRMPQFGPTQNENRAEPKPLVSVTIVGNKPGSRQPLTMTLYIDRESWTLAESDRVTVFGTLIEGQRAVRRYAGPQGKPIHGDFSLTKSGDSAGEEIEGEFRLNVVEVHGGFFNR